MICRNNNITKKNLSATARTEIYESLKLKNKLQMRIRKKLKRKS